MELSQVNGKKNSSDYFALFFIKCEIYDLDEYNDSDRNNPVISLGFKCFMLINYIHIKINKYNIFLYWDQNLGQICFTSHWPHIG